MSVHFILRLEAAPGKEAALRQELLRAIERARTETGNLNVYLFESLQEPVVFAVHSQWVDEAAFEVHTKLPHVAQFRAVAEPLLTHPLQGLRLREIGGGPATVDTAG